MRHDNNIHKKTQRKHVTCVQRDTGGRQTDCCGFDLDLDGTGYPRFLLGQPYVYFTLRKTPECIPTLGKLPSSDTSSVVPSRRFMGCENYNS